MPCSEHHPPDLPPEQYAYLLGIYLGDGYLSRYPRDVWKLRVACDTKYPGIIDAVGRAMEAVRGSGRAAVHKHRDSNCVDVSLYWKHWPCVFPQHGPGRKHRRAIELVDWQEAIVANERPALLCGLIDSDGCRIRAIYKESGRIVPRGRYVFSNRSSDIHAIFRRSLDVLGVRWTQTRYETVVARQRDVRRLDHFIGPKE